MVRGSGHGDDNKSLNQNADGEDIHGEACRVDLPPKNVDDAGWWFIPAVARGNDMGCKLASDIDTGSAVPTRGTRQRLVMELDSLIARKLF